MSLPVLSSEDICIWPDGVWCYRDELVSFGWRSDDYLVLWAESAEWCAFLPLEGCW